MSSKPFTGRTSPAEQVAEIAESLREACGVPAVVSELETGVRWSIRLSSDRVTAYGEYVMDDAGDVDLDSSEFTVDGQTLPTPHSLDRLGRIFHEPDGDHPALRAVPLDTVLPANQAPAVVRAMLAQMRAKSADGLEVTVGMIRRQWAICIESEELSARLFFTHRGGRWRSDAVRPAQIVFREEDLTDQVPDAALLIMQLMSASGGPSLETGSIRHTAGASTTANSVRVANCAVIRN